jgi:hypothetical protein
MQRKEQTSAPNGEMAKEDATSHLESNDNALGHQEQ